jgi:hypothetical protein
VKGVGFSLLGHFKVVLHECTAGGEQVLTMSTFRKFGCGNGKASSLWESGDQAMWQFPLRSAPGTREGSRPWATIRVSHHRRSVNAIEDLHRVVELN